MTPSPTLPQGGGRRDLERLKWKSRRGLLELDLVLERFWAKSGVAVDAGEAAGLERLLAMPDNDLLDLVMGRAETPETHLRAMVEKLRAA
jgi:succinate dehydrogenase flavin-adding protein (antitoxin of CptAB toxin-antitoxin module)